MSKEEKTSIETDALDDAFSDMNLLNEKEKEVYRVDSETIRLSQIDYKLIENYKEAFDLDLMEKRYSDYLLKYDYIVGDISYQKLRLRGFFDDQRKGVPIDMKIANLEDYLVEYCSFGSPYFVLERVEKRESDPESYFKKKRKRHPSQRRRSRQGSSYKGKRRGTKSNTRKKND